MHRASHFLETLQGNNRYTKKHVLIEGFRIKGVSVSVRA